MRFRHPRGDFPVESGPLTDDELDECRRITGTTPMDAVSIGTPDVVVHRLIATIDDLRERLTHYA